MAFPILMAVGAGLGAAKYEQDRRNADRQRQSESTIAAYSPWTGMQAQRVNDPDFMASTLQGASTGASLGQSMENADAAKALQASQVGMNNAAADYYQTQAQGGSAGAIGPVGQQPPVSQELMYANGQNMSMGSPYPNMQRRY